MASEPTAPAHLASEPTTSARGTSGLATGAYAPRAPAVAVGSSPRRVALLRAVGVLATAVVAVVLVVGWWEDSGTGTLLVVGVPLAAAALVVLAGGGRAANAVTWLAAVVVIGWALVTGLGAGFWFIVPGALLLTAAVDGAGISPADRARP
ncbi:hypothetical protein [Actinotalea solisilvae]|uniref:hypothetical protein n=1 Tax=Actinotalea solisilvae TaxID=2072922 RepID=UPI0018F226BA|nr:hypothetical protein [Actinotalea solisilvae]